MTTGRINQVCQVLPRHHSAAARALTLWSSVAKVRWFTSHKNSSWNKSSSAKLEELTTWHPQAEPWTITKGECQDSSCRLAHQCVLSSSCTVPREFQWPQRNSSATLRENAFVPKLIPLAAGYLKQAPAAMQWVVCQWRVAPPIEYVGRSALHTKSLLQPAVAKIEKVKSKVIRFSNYGVFSLFAALFCIANWFYNFVLSRK